MKEIPLRNDPRKILVDDEDFVEISTYKWRVSRAMPKGRKPGPDQIRATVPGTSKQVLLHRVILKPSAGLAVDHINRNVLDNRRTNLRICSNADNVRNRTKPENTAFRFKGVRLDHYTPKTKRSKTTHKRWRVILVYKGKAVYRDRFETEEAAAIAYDLAAKSWFGEFASCNILSDGAF